MTVLSTCKKKKKKVFYLMSHAVHPDQLQAQTHMQIWTPVNFISGKDILHITPKIIILQRKKIAKLDSLKIKNQLWEKLSRE